ncbi:MAG: tRNA 2-thiouridine(34) synthase MnmA [Actinobacteria bacterium]|nr:tRNA 2-thiouridine(34) synthase MnmA [Actinomycetota bacterium]
MSRIKLVEIIKRNKHAGILPDPDGVGEAGSEECGGKVIFYLKVDDGVISKISFLAFGPPLLIALSVLMCERFEGGNLLDAANFYKDDLVEILGEGNRGDICFDISWLAFRRCIDSAFSNYKGHIKMGAVSNLTVCSMSGGVDSSVALLLLKEAGHNLIGVTLDLFGKEDNQEDNSADQRAYSRSCCSPQDIEDARSVCEKLRIPHITLDVKKEFKRMVIDRFTDAYLRGVTPNPCVDCNRYMRFDFLLKKISQFGANRLATGHYARIQYEPSIGKFTVRKGVDSQKDQSYVFWPARQDVLERIVTPLGEKTKPEVRQIALENNLPVFEKLESQDICFIRDGDHADFIERTLGYRKEKGPIYDERGNQIGVHKGYIYYTVGQRKGLNIGSGGPYFVIRIDPVESALCVSNNPRVGAKEVILTDVNYIFYDIPPGELDASVMVRYRSLEYPARIVNYEGNRAKVFFKNPVRFPSPGQSAVFYDGDLLIGGGVIADVSSFG